MSDYVQNLFLKFPHTSAFSCTITNTPGSLFCKMCRSANASFFDTTVSNKSDCSPLYAPLPIHLVTPLPAYLKISCSISMDFVIIIIVTITFCICMRSNVKHVTHPKIMLYTTISWSKISNPIPYTTTLIMIEIRPPHRTRYLQSHRMQSSHQKSPSRAQAILQETYYRKQCTELFS